MEFPLPPLTVTAALLPFVAVAVSMIAVTIFLLGKVLPAAGRPPLVSQMVLVLAVLAGGSLLLLALLFVFLNPNGTDAWTWVLLSFNFMMMFPVGIWFVGLVIFRDRRIDASGWSWPILISITVTGSEALMGILFAIGAAPADLSTVGSLALGLSSIWFFWSMAAVMGALVAWAPLAPVERWALLALAAAAVVAPWVTTFPAFGGAATAVLMGAVFAGLVRHLSRGGAAVREVPFLGGLAGAFLAMALAGLAVAADPRDPYAILSFGATTGVVMAVEIAYLIRRYYHGNLLVPWIPRSDDDAEESPTGRAGASLDPRSPDASLSAR